MSVQGAYAVLEDARRRAMVMVQVQKAMCIHVCRCVYVCFWAYAVLEDARQRAMVMVQVTEAMCIHVFLCVYG